MHRHIQIRIIELRPIAMQFQYSIKLFMVDNSNQLNTMSAIADTQKNPFLIAWFCVCYPGYMNVLCFIQIKYQHKIVDNHRVIIRPVPDQHVD